MTITIPDDINWKTLGANIASALTMISIIPYDKDTMSIVNQVVPQSWIPYIIKAGIGATIILRLWDWWSKRGTTKTVTGTPSGELQELLSLAPQIKQLLGVNTTPPPATRTTTSLAGVIPQQPK